jgi:hypothetical protein
MGIQGPHAAFSTGPELVLQRESPIAYLHLRALLLVADRAIAVARSDAQALAVAMGFGSTGGRLATVQHGFVIVWKMQG